MAGRSRHRNLGREHRGLLRQRIGRKRRRTVQNRGRQTPRTVEIRTGRMGNTKSGALVQQTVIAQCRRLLETKRSAGGIQLLTEQTCKSSAGVGQKISGKAVAIQIIGT